MFLSALIYLGFGLTATAGVFWIAYETRGRQTAWLAALLTLGFFLVLAAALFIWVLPELRSIAS